MKTVAKIADVVILTSYKVGFRARNITSGIGGYFQNRHSEGNNKDKIESNEIEKRKAKEKLISHNSGSWNWSKNWWNDKIYQ